MKNIIGTSGKIGSGKDLIGTIIQYLHSQSKYDYKGSFTDFQKDLVKEPYGNTAWQIKKMAGKLKQIASLLTGIPIEKFEDQEFKKTFLSREWDTIVSKPGKRQDGLFGNGEKEIRQMTVREFLQKLGTDAMRDGLHTNVWVNAFWSDYKYIPGNRIEATPSTERSFPNWIITDMRFPNELKAIEDRGGISIRIEREHCCGDVGFCEHGDGFNCSKPLNTHESETTLDEAEFDYTIENNGTIEDLIEKVKVILIKEKII